MRILFVSPRQAWPANSGAKLRDYHFARAVGQEADLTYVLFAEPGSSPDLSQFAFARRVQAVPKPKGYTLGKILRGVFGPRPLSVENYTSESMSEALSSIAADGPVDLIHLDALQLAGYTPVLHRAFPKAPIVYNWHNIESELMDRFAATTESKAKRFYARMTARRLRTLERLLLHEAFGHIVCSGRERDELAAIAPGARIAVIDNGVDTEFFASVHPATAPRRLVFVGLMSYHANIEAAVWFARAIWPHIHARYPQLTLTFVGHRPAPAVLALQENEGVEVTGTVDDVRPYYAEAVAAIAPIRTAGGTRLKILEAMAAGVPMLSTTIGAEGLEVEAGRHLLIGDTEEEWLRMTAQVLDEGTRSELVAAGRELVQRRYDWSALGRQLCGVYEAWLKADG